MFPSSSFPPPRAILLTSRQTPRVAVATKSSRTFAGAEELVIKFLQFQSFLRAEPGAAQANGIQSAHAIAPAGDGVRRQIPADGRAALHEGQGADTDEL